MPLDEQRFPELIRDLYRIVGELETMFPGRPFTPDGHMVGSLAECYAEYHYGLNLYACSHPGHDAHLNECRVEIKATQGDRVAFRSAPDRLLVFRLSQGPSRKCTTARALRFGLWSHQSHVLTTDSTR